MIVAQVETLLRGYHKRRSKKGANSRVDPSRAETADPKQMSSSTDSLNSNESRCVYSLKISCKISPLIWFSIKNATRKTWIVGCDWSITVHNLNIVHKCRHPSKITWISPLIWLTIKNATQNVNTVARSRLVDQDIEGLKFFISHRFII